jgi:hypothetical protein
MDVSAEGTRPDARGGSAMPQKERATAEFVLSLYFPRRIEREHARVPKASGQLAPVETWMWIAGKAGHRQGWWEKAWYK